MVTHTCKPTVSRLREKDWKLKARLGHRVITLCLIKEKKEGKKLNQNIDDALIV